MTRTDRIVLYIEGQPPAVASRPVGALVSDDRPLVIGANHRDSLPMIDDFFRGDVFDARFYGVALDEARIEALFRAGPS